MPALDSRQAAWLASRGVAGPFRSVGGGFRTDVFESREGRIVRVGKSPASDNTFSTEQRVMGAVRRHVDVAVPRPTIVEDDLTEFPHGLMVYPKLAGTTPTAPSHALAKSAASVLRQLHTMVTDFDAPNRAIDPNGVAALVHVAKPRLTEAQGLIVDRWRADPHESPRTQPAIVPGPWRLLAGQLARGYRRDHRQTALDFERSGIGLPHEDLAPLAYLGERFRDAVLDAYCDAIGGDPASLREEIQVFEVLRELRGLGWALRNPDAGEVDDAVEKVAGVLARYV